MARRFGTQSLFELTIVTTNASFDDGCGLPEIARILREAADAVEANGPSHLRDINGNIVGEWVLS